MQQVVRIGNALVQGDCLLVGLTQSRWILTVTFSSKSMASQALKAVRKAGAAGEKVSVSLLVDGQMKIGDADPETHKHHTIRTDTPGECDVEQISLMGTDSIWTVDEMAEDVLWRYNRAADKFIRKVNEGSARSRETYGELLVIRDAAKRLESERRLERALHRGKTLAAVVPINRLTKK